MKFAALAAALSLAFPSALSHPVVEEHAAILEERQSSVVLTTGAQGTKVYPRLEIRQMQQQQPDQWTLFLLAMQAFKNQSQASATSYYQIAGIHGVPRQNYNGVGQCSSCGDADGYCPHDSVLFPGWHRAYLALFEQQFIATVNTIVAQYPAAQQTTMKNAAAAIRLPYWDWAGRPSPGTRTMPGSITDERVTVNGPKGQVTINNPLYRHDFADNSKLVYYPFVQWPSTYRYPNTNNPNAVSQQSLAISAMDNIRQNLQDQVYQLMTTCTDYLHFSNDQQSSSTTSCSNSLEGIHNNIHIYTGGGGNSSVTGGHMFYLATSAFDPVFWLHHCNVDRLFAIWQAINPGSYGASQTAPHDTWTVAGGSNQGSDSPLTPFYRDNKGTFWTTNSVKNWNTTFKYTYPEFSNSDGSKAAIVSYVNKLYGPSATATAGSTKRTAGPEPVEERAAATSSAAASLATTTATPLTASNGSLYQYVANIQTPRYALNGTYNIFVFHGPPVTEDPSTWTTDTKLIGPMGVLSQTDMTGHNVLASGSVPLTRTLTEAYQAGKLSGLSKDLVTPYLKKNLEWRIAGPNGDSIDPGSIAGFKISVVSSTATQPKDIYSLPVYSPFTALAEITDGSSGGLNISGLVTGTVGSLLL